MDMPIWWSVALAAPSVEAVKADFWSSLESATASLESVATAVALTVGGIWTYFRFVKGRIHFAKASLTHHVDLIPLQEDDGDKLLRIRIEIKNIGQRMIPLREARSWIRQIAPVSNRKAREAIEKMVVPQENGKVDVPWPCLGRRDWIIGAGKALIEPGESEVLLVEFLVPNAVNAILVYSYVKNSTQEPRTEKGEIGWQQATVLQIGKGGIINAKTTDTTAAAASAPGATPTDS